MHDQPGLENMVMKLKKGDVIFREGEFEMSMFDLLEGTVGIYLNYGTPEEKLLTELNAGNETTFGEMGLVDAMPRSATAVAMEDSKVCKITGDVFGEYFKDSPEAVFRIMRNISRRIRALTEDYLDVCRAVAEAADAEREGTERSSWFWDKVEKFARDYNRNSRSGAGKDDEFITFSIYL